MKTTTTYKAEIEVLVPEGLLVFAQSRLSEISSLDETSESQVWLVIEARSDENPLDAKRQIGQFVNEVMEAERS